MSARLSENAARHIEFELTRGWGDGDLFDEVATEVSVYFRPLPEYDWLLFNGEPTSLTASVHGFLVHQLPLEVILDETPNREAFSEEENPLGEILEPGFRVLADLSTGEVVTELFRFNPEYPLHDGP